MNFSQKLFLGACVGLNVSAGVITVLGIIGPVSGLRSHARDTVCSVSMIFFVISTVVLLITSYKIGKDAEREIANCTV
jgi:uncharacterized membrane protein